MGAHLVNAEARGVCSVSYWREGDREVDFVVRSGWEVLVGGDGIPTEAFLARPVEEIVALTGESR